jgi:hypothetical protein
MSFFHITDNLLYFSLEPLIEKLLKNQSVTSPFAVEHIHKIKIIVWVSFLNDTDKISSKYVLYGFDFMTSLLPLHGT